MNSPETVIDNNRTGTPTGMRKDEDNCDNKTEDAPKLVSPAQPPEKRVQPPQKVIGKKHSMPDVASEAAVQRRTFLAPQYPPPPPYHSNFDMSHLSSMQLLNAMIHRNSSSTSSSSLLYPDFIPPAETTSSSSHPYYYHHNQYPPYYYPGYDLYSSQYNRKRQRRQAAAVVVDSLFSNNNNHQAGQAAASPNGGYGQQQQQQQQLHHQQSPFSPSVHSNVGGAFDGQQQSTTTPMGRKSTAQPRPALNVPPRGIGPIVDPNINDVLCGRGGRINSHAGNVQFRDVIQSRKKEYLAPSTKKLEKAHIAAAIVNDIRGMDPPGRFLKEDRDTGLWFDIGDAKAIKKTGQALREDAPDIRHELEGDSSGDEKGQSLEPAAVKKERSLSPKARPKVPISASSPLQQQQQRMTGHGPQQMPPWSQQGAPVMTQYDFHAQAAMPPPNNAFVNNNTYASSSQQQQQQQMHSQGFATRNIPIQAPPSNQNTMSSYMPQNLYLGARSISGKAAAVSKQAMSALNPLSAMYQQQRPPDDIAFGRAFHPPEASPTVLSGTDNTMSTISGLSETLSSALFGPNSLMSGGKSQQLQHGSSGIGGSGVQNSLRLSSLGGSLRGSSAMHLGSANNWARNVHSINSAANNSLGSSGSSGLIRSFSFPDMNSVVEGDNWKSIMEADDEALDNETAMARSVLSSGSRTGGRQSSAMSISGLSLASNASSTQWLAATGLMPGAAAPMPDDRTYLSGMSTDLDALDLANAEFFR